MTLYHTAYLFDYEDARREFLVLRPECDCGNYASLCAQGHRILQNRPHIWKTLEDFRWGPEDADDYDREDWGKISTLAILAQYLELCPSIDQPTWEILLRKAQRYPVRNWQIVQKGLQEIGWTVRDVTLLVEGMSTDWLLCPNLVSDPIERLPPSREWYSIGRTGWLDMEEIQRLLLKLEQSRRDFYKLKPDQLPLRDSQGQPVSDEQLELAFVCAVGMLKTAQVANKGLFLAILS